MGWGYHHGFFPFGPIFCALFLAFVIFRIFAFRRCGWRRRGWHGDDRFEAEAILQRRLASGEITAEEYHRLKEILKK
jgi:uncharacterized membrane protein